MLKLEKFIEDYNKNFLELSRIDTNLIKKLIKMTLILSVQEEEIIKL